MIYLGSVKARLFIPSFSYTIMHKYVCVVLLLLSFTGAGCDSNGGMAEEVGTLFIIVKTQSGSIVEGAAVSTDPPTETHITDVLGTVTLSKVPVGTYSIAATKEEIGSGKKVVAVTENEVSEVNIALVPGVFFSYAPTVDILLPESGAGYAEGEEITFSAHVADQETPPQELDIRWLSSVDGEFNTTAPDNQGRVSFSTSSLSPAEHVIYLEVTDSDDQTSVDSVLVSTLYPRAVELQTPTKEDGKVFLAWTASTSSSFAQYEVYRKDPGAREGKGVLLATITNASTTTTVDELPPFVAESFYSVVVTTTQGYQRSSNEQRVEEPAGPVLGFVPFDVVRHPSEPRLYALDRTNARIVVIDYERREVVQEKEMDGFLGYMDVGDNGFGTELYVPGSDGFVYVLDAASLNQVAVVNTGLSNTSVVIDGRGHVYVALQPSPWWEQPVRTYSRETGLHIDGNGDFDGDRLRMLPSKLEIISITTSVSPVDMEYFRFNEDATFAEHRDDRYHGDHPLDSRIFRIAPGGAYSITSSRGAVYTADGNMEYLGQVQRGSLSFSDFAFDESGETIYAATGNRASIQVASYPALTRSSEILTRGFPAFIFRDDDRLVGLSRSTENANTVGIDVVAIN